MSIEMGFGVRIKTLRQQKKYSQEFMAKSLGMSTPGYNKIERGKSNPSWERIRKIAEILGVDPQELLVVSQLSKATEQMKSESAFLQRIQTLEREMMLKDEIIYQLKKRLNEA